MRLRTPIFYFHRVASDGLEAAVPAEVFAGHLALLQDLGAVSVSLEQVALALADPRHKLPPRAVNLSFDDCFADVAEHALPLLERHGFRASFFAVAGCLGGRSHWGQGQAAGLRLMDAAMLRELAAAGHEVGSHGFSHRSLPWLGDDELWAELIDSRHKLEDILGRAVNLLAYPYGDAVDRVRAAARQAGYLAARGLRRGNLHSRHSLFDLAVINSMRLRGAVRRAKMAHYLGPWYELGARKEELGRWWRDLLNRPRR